MSLNKLKLAVRKAGLPPLFISVLGSICILALLSLAVQAQPKHSTFRVEGTVVDQTGAALAGALVAVSDPAFKARVITDAEGRFRFEAASLSALTLTVTAPGFAQVERKLAAGVDSLSNLRIMLAPANVSGRVTIVATRTETRISETAARVISLNAENLNSTAAATLDDALRQAAGFSLFRRSGSRTANPTTQGVSLRGLGASGASRALVLADGVPLNDPFGGWVYWDRVPRSSIAAVEVLHGGASHLYGSSALGGVVNISTRRPENTALSLETYYGNQTTPGASLFLVGRKGDWGASLSSEIFSTRGYVLVAPAERGAVDTNANSRHGVMTLRVDRRFGSYQRVFGSASFFRESRENGTPLQTNRTHVRQFLLGGEIDSFKSGSFSIRGWGGTQVYDQTFSAVSADRNSEALTRLQRVPVQFVGFSTQWTQPFGTQHTLVAGYESLQVRGASDEVGFINGRAASLSGAGGRQQTHGAFLQDLIKIGSRFFINAGGRVDYWGNHRAFSATVSVAPGSTAGVISFPNRTESAFSPRLSGVFKINERVSLLASGTRAFRAPTLNELYRSFRVGNVLTLANETLRAERLTGVEAGVRFTASQETAVFRGAFFWNQVDRPVANVTLTATPNLITRQRQNLGTTRSRGLELDIDARVNQNWKLSAGYVFAAAVVVRFPANTALEGLSIPQVARHQFTFQVRYSNPRLLNFGLQGRASSSQFDDDQNLFRLGKYFTTDLFLSRRLTRGLDAFVAAENLLNQRYEVGKTPVTTLGPPILIRAGIRLELSAK
ncbi:MAG TPA: TonB-dependent receptor [Pyrinomonadaceae bacterium]|nr:TonB-dependent receptor [Pyrinomonadaceae bacterium]